MANGRLGPPWRVVRVLSVWRVFKVFKRLRAGKRQAWTPIRRHWCVALGCLLAAGWSMPRECLRPGKRQAWTPMTGCKGLSVWRVFKRLRAGKRQAWTPIRRHWCVALGCLLAARWSMPRECLRPGKRQASTPIRSHWCVALRAWQTAGLDPHDGL